MSQQPGRSLLVTLLVVALAVAAPLAVALARPYYANDAVLLGSIGFGLGYTALAGVYLVLGRPGFWTRLPIALALAIAGGVVSALADRSRISVWCGVSLFNAVLLATPILYLWGRGLRLVHPDDVAPLPHVPRRRQFSLRSAMWATTSLAILLGVARYLEFPIDRLAVVGAIFAATACIGWAGAAALLSRIPTSLGAAALAGAMLPAALALPGFARHFSLNSQFPLVLATVAPLAVVVGATMMTVRAAGYYLRWPTYEAPAPAPPRVDDEPTDADILPLPPRSKNQSNHSSEASNLG